MKALVQFAWARCLALALALAMLCAMLTPLSASGGAFPDRRVTIVVAYPAGGSSDIFARAIANKLTQTWGHPVVVDNRGGGGTIVGTQFVAQSAPDGYTLLVTAYAYTANPLLKDSLPYDPASLVPLALIGTSPSMLVINAGLPTQSLGDLITMARAKPGALVLGSSGNGSSPHIAAELFANEVGIDITHVPYKGMGPAMNDLLGGQVMGIFDIPTSMANVRNGRLRAIGIAAPERHPAAPEVPTFRELGVDLVSGTWYGFFVPAGTPASVQSVLHEAIESALVDPAVRSTIDRTGLVIQPRSQDEFRQFLVDESAKLKRLIDARGMKISID